MQPNQAAAGNAAPACADFNSAKLEESSWGVALLDLLSSYPVHRLLARVLRLFTPVPRALGWALVLRHDDVREVLENDRAFPVPWDRKMVSVTGGASGGRNFVLGMERDADYRLSYAQLAEAFPLKHVGEHVEPLSKDSARRIIDALGPDPEFDAIEALITAVPTELCETYYGIEIPADIRIEFAKWTLAISSYLFGPPFDKPKPLRSPNEPELNIESEDAKFAHAAARCLRTTIYDSIASARQRRQSGAQALGVVLPRLLDMQARDPQALTDEMIHAQLFGMVMGFIPTNVLAGGNMLDTLLSRPEFMKRARAAAQANDNTLLWRCLREALRFRNINLGPWRVCAQEFTLHRNSRCKIRIKPGTRVLASTQAAMFDPDRIERATAFDPERRDEDYLVFGVGQHWCLGAYIAIAQLTQTFKPLLLREGLARADGRRGRMQRFRVFPLHMFVRYRP
jgi:cytochrome P450